MSLRAAVPPDARRALGRKAALQRHHPERAGEIVAAEQEAKYLTLADYIARTVDAAPRLTAEQRASLALLLRAGAASDAA